ncbi:MAG TPA: methyltransferase domain-containing protein [Burkholderiales bacterium]|nr:methyltransferase domain-containing protein [Burkholderiales bacterium]
MNFFGARPKTAERDLQTIKRKFDHDGYAILPGFFSTDVCDRISREVDSFTSPERQDKRSRITVDILHGDLQGRLIRIADAPDSAFSGPFKINNLFTESVPVAEAVFDRRLTGVLEGLLERPPVAINSLNFVFGSQQPDHIDTWYMPPPVAGSLIVVSLCLEDTHPDAGPLFYYPGSHRIPHYKFSHGGINAVAAEMPGCNAYLLRELASRRIEKTVFIGKKGDIFIWHCQLLHGGSPIADRARTRKSLVVHYWGTDAMQPEKIRSTPSGGRFLDRDYWVTDDLPAPVQAKPSSLQVATPVQIVDAGAQHIAFDTWEGKGETLEAIEARIHDGVPVARLRERAEGYLNTFQTLYPESIPRRSSRIMEIGSGVGYVMEAALRRYHPVRLVGLDIAAGMIEFAKQRLRRDGVDTRSVEFVHYDGIDAPLPDASFDMIYSVASLQHAPKPFCFRAISEAYRLLATGGTAWIHLLAYSHFRENVTPERFRHELLQQIHNRSGHWHHYYTAEELAATLQYGIGVSQDHFQIRELQGSLYINLHRT